jgi:hypothetical protein
MLVRGSVHSIRICPKAPKTWAVVIVMLATDVRATSVEDCTFKEVMAYA